MFCFAPPHARYKTETMMSGRNSSPARPYGDHNPIIFACQPWLRKPASPPSPPKTPKPRLSTAQTRRRREAAQSGSLIGHRGKRCPYCGNIMVIEGVRRPTRDHVVPRCEGGTAILIVCAECNAEKGAMPPDAFLKRRRGCRRTLALIAMIGALRKVVDTVPENSRRARS